MNIDVDLAAMSGSARRALRDLFAAEVDNVHGFVFARCGSPSIAEDVTGDVFCDAAKRFNQGRGDEVTRGWLFEVARRRLIDHWRRSGAHHRRVAALRAQPLFDVQDVADHTTDNRVADALLTLPDRQRAALVLRYLDEFSVSEVADALDVEYQAAESLLARARRSFSRAYGEQP